jgi:hypothetical protein
VDVCIHPVRGREADCHAISLDGRWLCTSTGRLTVFQGLQTVLRFLGLANVADYTVGEALEFDSEDIDEAYCLCLRQGQEGLQSCNRTDALGCPMGLPRTH